jgi:hypothetical protein
MAKFPTTGPNKHLSDSQIKKTLGKKGSLHKKLGIPANQKIGPSRLAALASKGNKAAALAYKLNGYGKGKKSNGPKAKGSTGSR